MHPHISALDRAAKAVGGLTALAAAIDVKGSTPSMWKARGSVPAEHCPAIERETRRVAAEQGNDSLIVTCDELCPDVAWSVLRDKAAA
jgi:DNA-binding transcriptional regulator YdaS (Cro superfamily)